MSYPDNKFGWFYPLSGDEPEIYPRCGFYGHEAEEHYPDEAQNAVRPHYANPVETCNVSECSCTDYSQEEYE